jgi:small subunit ribosomal protein S1
VENEDTVAASEDKKKKPRTAIEDLKVGDEVEGKIKSVLTYGAFVDINANTDALLHVSEISNEFVEDATAKLTKGETVKGRIKAINLEKKQIAMTCKEARPRREPRPKVDLSQYESADPKEFVTGKVNSITDFGAFVTLEGGADGLVHISQIQEGGVGKVSDVLEVG